MKYLSKYLNFKANWIMNVGLLFSKWRGRWKRCLKFTLFSVIQIFKYEVFNLSKWFKLKYFKANWVLASSAGDAEGALTAAKLHESYFNLVLKFVTSLKIQLKSNRGIWPPCADCSLFLKFRAKTLQKQKLFTKKKQCK